MYKKLFYLITVVMLFCLASSIQAEPFSLGAVGDITIDNSTRYGPDASPTGTGLEARDIASRRHVFLISYDISELKKAGQFSNVSFSHVSHDVHSETNIYGIIEELDLLEVESLTWNTSPGVQNDPTPEIDSPVELDYADLTDILVTFVGPGAALQRFSTDTSQALADFLNSDTDGIVTFLFAPSAEGNQLIIRSREHDMGGSLLEGELAPILGIALDPNPADGAVDEVRDVVLSWTPGTFADTHDVYLGTNLDDVNNADASSSLLIGPAHDANNFYAGRLEFDQTYFWRIDEVNAPPNPTVFKGNIWSFTAESFAYPIPEESITATASSSEEGQGPENTINNSGLDVNDLHSNDTTEMWLTALGEAAPAWIQYEFDKPYKLHEMLVWNYNGESILALQGLKDVIVEYSMDGANWSQIIDVSEFAQALGTDGYSHNTTVAFDGAAGKFVRITANSIWGSGIFPQDQYGLSEVRFMQIPANARQPSPANEATDVAVDTTLNWRAGREAAEHNVLLSTDEQAVVDGSAPAITVSQNSFSPTPLDLESTYFWRVDEVNNVETPSIWQSNIWSFNTQESLIVDDFESYNDISEGQEGSNLVYITWEDGYVNPATNGSTMGYVTGTSMETDIVYGGNQSVPLFYNNTSASLSEVTVDPGNLPIDRNWSKGSPQVLVVWIYGDPGNTGNDKLYVKIGNSKFPYDGDIARPQWKPMIVDLTGVNLNNVSSLTIGIERSGGAGGSGIVFIDEIVLAATAPAVPSEEVWVEAETGTVTTPMMIYDDPNASGGKYVSTVSGTASEGAAPPYPNGTVNIPFTVAGGTYTARFRIGFPGGDDSCWVRIQDATLQADMVIDVSGWIEFNDIPTGDYWHWSQEVKSEDDPVEPPVEFTLSAGTHNLEISYRGANLRIDAIVFTKVD